MSGPGDRAGRDAAYRACAAEGLSQSETAARLGVSRAAVSIWAKRNGVRFRDGRNTPLDAAYRACAAEGLSLSEAARRLGMSVSAVGKWALRNGVSFRDGRLKETREVAP